MTNYGFDRLVVSSDDSCFLEFAPIVSKSWRALFPGLKLTLAYVTKDSTSQEKKLQVLFDDILIYEPIDNVPNANLAKIARRHACTQYENEICMIEDIDSSPLRSDYIINYAQNRIKGTMGLVGREVYTDGKVPASNTVAESNLWREIINPGSLEFKKWVESMKGLKVFDNIEDPYNVDFSDESLMRALIKINNVNSSLLTHINRNCNPKTDWIDRSNWLVDEEKLKNHGYSLVNFMRPIDSRANIVVNHIYNSLLP